MPLVAACGNIPINLEGKRRLGNVTFQASTTIMLASLIDFGGDDGNGLLLVVCGDTALATEDILDFFA
jgi:hypothetical protein